MLIDIQVQGSTDADGLWICSLTSLNLHLINNHVDISEYWVQLMVHVYVFDEFNWYTCTNLLDD